MQMYKMYMYMYVHMYGHYTLYMQFIIIIIAPWQFVSPLNRTERMLEI